MDVITRHGKAKPEGKDLLEYQMGWTTGVRQYGPDADGKRLYIKDGETVRDVNEGFLREEFLDYTLPYNVNEDGTRGDIAFGEAETVYAQSTQADDPNFFGLTAGLISKRKDVFDENNTKMAEAVDIDFMAVNPGRRQYQLTSANDHADTTAVKTISFYSVSPEYLAKLKNSLEQKAVYSVDVHGDKEAQIVLAEDDSNAFHDLYTLQQYLKKKENLAYESGVQAIVKRDETVHAGKNITNNDRADEKATDDINGQNDSWLYVLVPTGEKITLQKYDMDGNLVSAEFDELEWQEIMPMEYTYHDPLGRIDEGLGIVTRAQNDSDSTIEVHLSDDTRSVIVTAYEKASMLNKVEFGKTSKQMTAKEIEGMGTALYADGNTYANVVTFKEKHYNPNDPTEIIETENYIDFTDFILDEGSWDK